MEKDITGIENIYKNYGFEIKKEDADLTTFLFKKGRYFGVDILPLNNSSETQTKTKNFRIVTLI